MTLVDSIPYSSPMHIRTNKHTADQDARRQLMTIYRLLYRAYGPQHWWPGDTPFEVMVGAVLTQNTAWANVERAIDNLKRSRLLTPAKMSRVPTKRLASLIRPSGYFNIKTKRLTHLLDFLLTRYSGSLRKMFCDNPAALRENLLSVSGIGLETADSILLYAGGLPFFVVDAYTKRILARHGIASASADYHTVQKLFMDNLRHNTGLYNEYHALIVRVGKEQCKKRNPLCKTCPLKSLL